MVNRDYDPTRQQRQVLDVFREEYQVNPLRIREVTGLQKQRVNDVLGDLQAAGWVTQVTRGLYRLVYDGECLVEQVIRCRNRDR